MSDYYSSFLFAKQPYGLGKIFLRTPHFIYTSINKKLSGFENYLAI